jgi:dipeptidyl aminopeptidase/acylaminoacyl peptidase
MKKIMNCLALVPLLYLGVQFADAQKNDVQKVEIHQKGMIPVANFFEYSQISRVTLSPNGKSMAAIVNNEKGRLMLVTIDPYSLEIKVLARYSDSDVGSVSWVNNERLVFTLIDRKTELGETMQGPGLFVISKNGGDIKQLIARSYGDQSNSTNKRLLSARHRLHSVIRTGSSNEIYVTETEMNTSLKSSNFNLRRLNVDTGVAVGLPSPEYTNSWVINNEGEPNLAISSLNAKQTIYYRDFEKQKWEKMFPDVDNDEEYTPLFMDKKGSVYVQTYRGKNFLSVYRYDLNTKKFDDEALFASDQFDFSGSLMGNPNTGELIGMAYETDAPAFVWFSPEHKKLQEKVDALLPATINSLQISRDKKTIVVRSSSDVNPGSYSIYQTEQEKLIPFGKTHALIDPSKMSQKDFVTYQARDGMPIPAYLTLPKGKTAKNLPLVLMVHGGPYVRGVRWNFNPEVQFLASRGYAVLEPEFRGSQGYGKKHEQAGWKQWGLTMQDDLVDAVQWAVKQGYVDPKRVCIAGASYGGYATKMGLIRDPDLYQCGVSWVGVSDIRLLYTDTTSDMIDETEKYWLPIRIGDLSKDKERFDATSPLRQAERLTKPLILAYGGEDRRVTLQHGTDFYDAVKKHNKDVDWVLYKNEGHGWRLKENNIDFWTKVEKFLNQHIGDQEQR